MRPVLTKLVLCLAVFLALLGDASGRAVLQPDEQALWPFDGLSAAQGNDGTPGGLWDALPSSEGFDVGIQVGPNLYAYCSQNPWTKFDPHGLTGWAMDFPTAPPQYTMANREYRTAYMQSAATGLAVGTVGILAATGVAEVAAAVGATGYVAAAVSGAAGGYASNATGNKIEGRPLNENAGTAMLFGAGTGMLFQGLMGGKAPGENPRATSGSTPAPASSPTSSAQAAAVEAEVATSGTATVMQNGKHFSVAVERGSHTHQVTTPSQITSAIVPATNAGPVTGSGTITVPNVAGAAQAQQGLMQQGNLGPYNTVENSCVSHVCDVLKAGGVKVPPKSGSAQTRFVKRIVSGEGEQP